MVIVRILVALIQAILKVFADAFVAGGVALTGFLIALALAVAIIWIVTLLAISLFRHVRSR
jgi:hypothetical protein